MRDALAAGDISDGHTRPLLMLIDRPEEQQVLFKDIIARRLTVRDAEAMARRVAIERVRHKELVSPDLMSLEKQLSERLGTRVRIEKKNDGGKLLIDFFSPEDLTAICLALIAQPTEAAGPTSSAEANTIVSDIENTSAPSAVPSEPEQPAAPAEPEDDGLYSINNFTL